MLSDVAFVVVQLRVAEVPLEIVAGAAENVMAGAGGGWGGGGVALAVEGAAGTAGS